MECGTKTRRVYSTGDSLSFGFTTSRNRWPAILSGVIQDVQLCISSMKPGEKTTEGLRIVADLQDLRDEIIQDQIIRPIPANDPVSSFYTKEHAQRGPANWLNTDWLFAECFMFKHIDTILGRSPLWRGHDVFYRQKMDSFRSSQATVVGLAFRYRELITRAGSLTADALILDDAKTRATFLEISEICLWGNVTDLSLLPNMSHEEMQKRQNTSREETGTKLLCNNLPQAWGLLRDRYSHKSEGGVVGQIRVDIVLDNAGFELYGDLFLAGWLLSTGIVDTVVLHPKSIPWFVSDVTPTDFQALLAALQNPRKFFDAEANRDGQSKKLLDEEVEVLNFLFKNWSGFVENGRLRIQEHPFWTHPGSFWRLPSDAPDLFDDLKQSDLIIFKGDLNYRKLVGDVAWDPTTPFSTTLGPLGEESDLNILALRTCKADVVVGLEPGVDEALKSRNLDKSAARKWAWTGDYAVASLSLGSKS